VEGWAETLDGREEGDHGLGHALTGGIGVEAAVEGKALRRVWGHVCIFIQVITDLRVFLRSLSFDRRREILLIDCATA
jgi:hypothetical protein